MIKIFLYFLFSNMAFGFHTFMGDDPRTGYVGDAIKFPFTKVWEVEVPGQIISSPVIYKDRVIITSRNGYIVALRLDDGEWLWDWSTSGFVDATPYISSDVVVVPSMDGYLYSFDINSPPNPTPLWQVDLKAPSVSSPLIYKNRIYIGVGVPENSFKIIDFKTGRILKEIKLDKPVNSPPTLCNERIFFGGSDGRIYSIDKDGNDLKYYQIEGGNFTMKSVSCIDGRIYALPGYDERSVYKMRFSGDFSDVIKSLPLTTNISQDFWNWQNTSSIASSSSAVYMVAGNENTYLFALPKDFDDSSFNLIFSSFVVGSINEYNIIPSPIYSSGYIFLTSNSGFRVISSTSGEVLWEDLGDEYLATPAIDDGYIVVANKDGKVKTYKASEYLSFTVDEIFYGTHPITLDILSPNATYWVLEYSADDINYTFLSSQTFSNSDEVRNFKIYDLDSTNLANGRYTLRVRFGDMVASKKIMVNHIPLPPYNLHASDYPDDNCNRININWQGQLYDEFRIYRSSNAIDFNLIATTKSLSYIDRYALCGTTYTYYITSYDGFFESTPSNRSSAYSVNNNPLNDNISPQAVDDLRVLALETCPGSVQFVFTQSGDDGAIGNAYRFEVFYSTSINDIEQNKKEYVVKARSGEIESGVIDGLLYGPTYYFMVKVYDYAGNYSSSNVAEVFLIKDSTPPSPPSKLIAYDTPGDRGGRITLEWEPSLSETDTSCSGRIYGYKIFRTTKTFNLDIPYTIIPSQRYGYIDNNAIVGVRYYYKVCSYDSANTSCTDSVWSVSADNYRYVSIKSGGFISDEKSNSSVYIKPNVLDKDDYLIFYKIDANELGLSKFSQMQSYNLRELFNPTSLVFKFESSNPYTQLRDNAEIKIVYNSTDVAHMNENRLRVYFSNDGKRWSMIRNSKLNADDNSITASYNKFGYYGVFEYVPSGGIFDDEWIYTYPNPARGDTLTFKFVVNYDSNVEIDIYNVAGELIKKLKKDNVSAGIIDEVVWNIKDIASGVYIYRFKARGSGGEKSVNKKLAIIH